MFRFSIREVMMATAIVGLFIGWLVNRQQLATELRQTKREMGRYHHSAELWREIALKFGHEMQTDGWYVRIDDDGTGWSLTSRTSLTREQASKLNSKEPLASPDSLLVLPDN